MKIALLLLAGLLMSSCSSMGSSAGVKPPANRSAYRIETVFGDSVQGQTYAFVRNPPYDGAEFNGEFQTVARFLQIEGMTSVDGTKMKPDFLVTYHASREDPPTGIAVGVILPYTHTVRITARKKGAIDWQVRVVGTSEVRAVRQHLYRLLGAARHYFGQSSAGEQRIYLSDDDVKMLEVEGSVPAPVPSSSVQGDL